MNRYSSLIICVMMVVAVSLNVGCGQPKQGPVTYKPVQSKPVQSKPVQPKPVQPKPVLTSVYCSHRVGSVVNRGESIIFRRKAANMSLEFTMKLEEVGFVYDGTYIGVRGSLRATSERYRYCWDEECFIAEKNRDGSWTIKSLPFMD